jgi:copper chaperone
LIKLAIQGMSCGHCVGAVSKALEAVAGVESVEVSLERGEARVEGNADAAVLIAAVEEEGYEARPAG